MLLIVTFAVRKCFIDLTGARYVRGELFFKVCQLQKQTQLAWMILGGFSGPCRFYFKHKVVATEVLIPSVLGPVLDIRSEPVENLTVQT